jgi:predicted amidohydrolase
VSATFRLACIQPNAGDDMAANIEAAIALVRAARADGADFIAMPENVSMMTLGRRNAIAAAHAEQGHPALEAFQALAGETGAWLLVGSLTIDLGDGMLANRSFLLDGAGAVTAVYDKIHMFDVDLDGGESYRESSTYRPGNAMGLSTTPWGVLGLTICYDLRFPGLYRGLAQAGAGLLAVPSAFTRQTGAVHWHVLLRARAIENGCYVFAPAQCGDHPRGRQTYGHSLIVDPWGEVLADGGETPGFVAADIDMARVASARRAIPSLDHDRPYRKPGAKQDRIRAAGE